jgi:FlaA1/EpsC-like NDP-sugar epimerase
VDIKIAFCGVRPGEKLYEELAIDGEGVARTAHPKIGIWQNIPGDWDALVPSIEALLSDADRLGRDDVRQRLKEIVPEFYLEPPAARVDAAPANGNFAAVRANVAPA